ncbi:MAG: aminotransferase class V-fold PLP-dependent enzyme [Deltaproteobacteria bacterium]|nr:aminotransferase class V-fold PLP-dependent enzyme [Deltaproteobacteria bacterium]
MDQGRHFLFIPGPTNVPERVLRNLSRSMEDHRGAAFPEFSKPLLADMKKLFKTEDGEVFIFPSSGTGVWEATLLNTLAPEDRVLASRFGTFSHLWIDMCERLGLKVDALEVEWGEGVPLDRYRAVLERDEQHEIRAVLACHNETATGVTSNLAGIREILDDLKHPALLFVDGVSSIGSLDFRMDEWGVDCAVTGSQKGLMLPAGLGIVGVSQKALEARKRAGLRRCYFDFEDMRNLNADGWFPYTPALGLLYGLRESLDMLFEEGLDNVFARHHRLAEGVRAAVRGWGLSLCAKSPEWESDTVSAIFVPEGCDAKAVIHNAYHTYNLSLGAGLMQLAGKVFRIGHLGDLNDLMCLGAISGVEMAMRDAGISIEPGSGVAAAQESYRKAAAAASK